MRVDDTRSNYGFGQVGTGYTRLRNILMSFAVASVELSDMSASGLRGVHDPEMR